MADDADEDASAYIGRIEYFPVRKKIKDKTKARTHNRELVYVVQDEVAGMTGGELPGGGSWLSLRQDENSLGLYAAGMLNALPWVSNLSSQ